MSRTSHPDAGPIHARESVLTAGDLEEILGFEVGGAPSTGWLHPISARFHLVELDTAALAGVVMDPDQYAMGGKQWDELGGNQHTYYRDLERSLRHGDAPPIVLVHDHAGWQLDDGWHRLSIARALGLPTIWAYVHEHENLN